MNQDPDVNMKSVCSKLIVGLASGLGALTTQAQTPTALSTAGMRHYLTKAEVQEALVGKTLVVTNPNSAAGILRRVNIQNNGYVYVIIPGGHTKNKGNPRRTGMWEIHDDGSLCIRWQIAPSTVDCRFFFRDGDAMGETRSMSPNAGVLFHVEKVE